MRQLTTDEITNIRILVARAQTFDGVAALNEDALLGLKNPGAHLVLRDGPAFLGYGIVDRHGHAQLVVDPAHRRTGLGSHIADQLATQSPVGWWAFGHLDAAHALANTRDLVAQRTLLEMGRPLDNAVSADRFDRLTGADIDDLLTVNRLAFAHHREQGALTRTTLAERMTQPWFAAEDVLVARNRDGRVIGFHWTKVDPAAGTDLGEVYVLAVHPDYHGQGLGRRLLNAGLAHLRKRGCKHVHLYVEAAEAYLVGLYESARFSVWRTDVLYGVRPGKEER